MAINYKVAQASGVTTSTAVYTPSTSGIQATIIGLIVANITSSNATASVVLSNSGSSTNLIYNVSIPKSTALDVLNSSKVVVPYGYTISVVSSQSVDVTISVVEVS
jgi:hypothetical protein